MTDFTRKNVMKWIQRLHVKSTYQNYMDDKIDYPTYVRYINGTINGIRHSFGIPVWGPDDLDIIWENLNFSSFNWKWVREEIYLAIAS